MADPLRLILHLLPSHLAARTVGGIVRFWMAITEIQMLKIMAQVPEVIQTFGRTGMVVL
jgi:hypothetical protein